MCDGLVTVPATGNGFTVITTDAKTVPQLFVTAYTIESVPAVTPVTMPVLPTVASAVLVLLHTPPGAASVSVIDESAHTLPAPEMVPATGSGLTVIASVVRHPVGRV
jgi:hypothetical protein